MTELHVLLPKEPKIVLIDQDDVIAGYKHKFCEIWNYFHPDKRLEYGKINSPYVEQMLPNQEDGIRIKGILTTPGFFLSLDPIDGAKDALEQMASAGHKVIICTSPLHYILGEPVRYLECESEKRRWLVNYLGETWHDKMITTPDKTLHMGHYLIDDNPSPKGLIKNPTWEHVLFEQPYNANIPGKRRINWHNWKDVLPELAGN